MRLPLARFEHCIGWQEFRLVVISGVSYFDAFSKTRSVLLRRLSARLQHLSGLLWRLLPSLLVLSRLGEEFEMLKLDLEELAEDVEELKASSLPF